VQPSFQFPCAYQVGVHEIVKPVLLDPGLFNGWERPDRTTTEMLGEENAANGEVLDILFDSYWKDFQPNLRESRKNGDII
jgi:hypothetical protein